MNEYQVRDLIMLFDEGYSIEEMNEGSEHYFIFHYLIQCFIIHSEWFNSHQDHPRESFGQNTCVVLDT